MAEQALCSRQPYSNLIANQNVEEQRSVYLQTPAIQQGLQTFCQEQLSIISPSLYFFFPDIMFHLAAEVTWQLQTKSLEDCCCLQSTLTDWKSLAHQRGGGGGGDPSFHYIIQLAHGVGGLEHSWWQPQYHLLSPLHCKLVFSAGSYSYLLRN